MDGKQFKKIDKVALFREIDFRELGDHIKNKQVQKSDAIFLCHPAAQSAFLTWSRLTKSQKFDWSSTRYANFLNQQISLFLLVDESQKTTKTGPAVYKFFNSFDILRVILKSDTHNDKFTIKLIKNSDTAVIEYLAWREVVALLYSNVLNKDTGLPNFRDLVNENMPAHLKLKFFHNNNLDVEQLIQEIKENQQIKFNRRQYDYLVAKRRSLNPRIEDIPKNIFFHQILQDAKHDDQ